MAAALPAASSAQSPVGPEFPVNSYATGLQRRPSVGSDASGNFVVVWHGSGPGDTYYGIFARRFDASGNPLGSEFRVNSHTTEWQSHPSVAVAADGAFVVVWHSFRQDASRSGGQFTPWGDHWAGYLH